MTTKLRLAFTADLHWGSRATGDAATRLLAEFLTAEPPDVLVLAGDIGAGDDFASCLSLFSGLESRKALVPGNHDIWVETDDPRGDSLQVYKRHLPEIAQDYGFHYLDQGPLIFPEASLALAGSINWYDYSWSIDALRQRTSDWEERLRSKRFTRGQHNDVRYVQWPLDDVRFTAQAAMTFEQHLHQASAEVDQVIVVTHHPPFYGLSFPRADRPTTLDDLLWEAFAGNRTVEAILVRYAERIPLAFCGHTHRARENSLGRIRGYNIGGDYSFKRLLQLDWPGGTPRSHVFGDPEAAP
jgi:3',5'-cyclic AMP phosphodiesterase CpdA